MRKQEVDANLPADLAAFVRRYVVLPSEAHSLTLGLWIIHTWLIEHARATPYLYVHSADKQCGKTRLLEVLEIVARNPMRATSLTPSVMYRALDVLKPTLLIDEVDTVWAGARNEIMRNIINSGYRRGGKVWRIANQQPRAFDTFGAKVLAGIFNGYMPDTITDRSIPIKLRRKSKDQHTEPFYADQVAGSIEVESLLSRIETFAKYWRDDVAYQRPDPIAIVNDRQWEITEPLVALAAVFGIEQVARKALTAMFADVKESPSLQSVLLGNLREAFGDSAKMFSADIVALLGATWSEKQLAIWLSPYGIAPRQIRIGNRTAKGYSRDQFTNVWED